MRYLIFLLCASLAHAALPTTAKWEFRTTGSNLNGGAFNADRGGTDYSLQDTAQEAQSDGASADTSTTFTSTAATFADAMKGNYIRISSGTQCTPGWYEVVSVTDADNVVLDRTPAASGQNCSSAVYKLGGAFNLGTANAFTLDDDVFEAAVAGNTYYIKAGTYTIGETITISAAGTTAATINIIGYNSSRGDSPTGSTRPLLTSTLAVSFGASWNVSNMQISSSATTGVTPGADAVFRTCKIVNPSTTDSRPALTVSQSDVLLIGVEAISYRGTAVAASNRTTLIGSYLHDSVIGLNISAAASAVFVSHTIIADNVSYAVQTAATATVASIYFANCTLYGSQNTTGVGVNLITGTANTRIINSILYGFTTAVAHADAGNDGWDNWNAYYNNDADVSQWTKGANDVATDPAFTAVNQLTGSTATTSGSVLTQTGAFSTVTDNVDFVYIASGTGVTAAKYLITSHTADTITLSSAPGDSAGGDVVWQITTGHNFAVGANMKALGFPGTFPGGSTGYLDIGAVQRVEPTASGGGSYAFVQ